MAQTIGTRRGHPCRSLRLGDSGVQSRWQLSEAPARWCSVHGMIAPAQQPRPRSSGPHAMYTQFWVDLHYKRLYAGQRPLIAEMLSIVEVVLASVAPTRLAVKVDGNAARFPPV